MLHWYSSKAEPCHMATSNFRKQSGSYIPKCCLFIRAWLISWWDRTGDTGLVSQDTKSMSEWMQNIFRRLPLHYSAAIVDAGQSRPKCKYVEENFFVQLPGVPFVKEVSLKIQYTHVSLLLGTLVLKSEVFPVKCAECIRARSNF